MGSRTIVSMLLPHRCVTSSFGQINYNSIHQCQQISTSSEKWKSPRVQQKHQQTKEIEKALSNEGLNPRTRKMISCDQENPTVFIFFVDSIHFSVCSSFNSAELHHPIIKYLKLQLDKVYKISYPHLQSSGKRYPDMTILSANILPVLGMTCQCKVKLNSLPRRLLPCIDNSVQISIQKKSLGSLKCLHWHIHKRTNFMEEYTWSTKRYLLAVCTQKFACSLVGIIASQSET